MVAFRFRVFLCGLMFLLGCSSSFSQEKSKLIITGDLGVNFEAPNQFTYSAGFAFSVYKKCYYGRDQTLNIYTCGGVRLRNSYQFGYMPHYDAFQVSTDFNYTLLILTGNLNVNYSWDDVGKSRFGVSPQLGIDFYGGAFLAGWVFYPHNDFSDRASRFTLQLNLYLPGIYERRLK